MNSFKIIFITLLLSGFSATSMAEGKLRVLDRGMDGNQRYYYVTCPDDNRGSVTVKYDMPETQMPETSEDDFALSSSSYEVKVIETCMFSHSGKHKCKSNWSVDEAAEASCK
jgi:hypothetical protein